MTELDQLKQLISAYTPEQRRQLFEFLREEFPIHAIELKFNARAEVILEAIDRASDLTKRGVRGVIAEAAFEVNVVQKLDDWTDRTPEGDFPFDFMLVDGVGSVGVQVKMQRQKSGRPMTAREGYAHLPDDMYVVETQRTRAGRNPLTKEDTRPYRFGEFDILAVSMHPSTSDWSTFRFTVANWLLERPDNSAFMLKFQPIPKTSNEFWTDDFLTCVDWFRSGIAKKIWRPSIARR